MCISHLSVCVINRIFYHRDTACVYFLEINWEDSVLSGQRSSNFLKKRTKMRLNCISSRDSCHRNIEPMMCVLEFLNYEQDRRPAWGTTGCNYALCTESYLYPSKYAEADLLQTNIYPQLAGGKWMLKVLIRSSMSCSPLILMLVTVIDGAW